MWSDDEHKNMPLVCIMIDADYFKQMMCVHRSEASHPISLAVFENYAHKTDIIPM
ncbi:hypothetical protein [Vibrio alfacsensis]|uniref:hypothetical protein n=1 Tax=Vibrio alfacsensis TaxID=1074311 RepID=UPI0040694878